MTQAIFAAKPIPIKAKILCGKAVVMKVDVRSMQVTGGKVKIPNGFSVEAKLLTTTMTAIALADMKEATCMHYLLYTNTCIFNVNVELTTFVAVDINQGEVFPLLQV